MGRRYGRNQKRKARLRIEELETAHRMADALLKRVASQRDRLRTELNMVSDALGPNFIGLSPVEAALKCASVKDGRMLDPDGDVATMHCLAVHTVDGNDSMDARMHIRANLADGSVAYAISQRALMDCEASFLAVRIAQELAPALVASLRRNGARQ